MKKLFTVDDFMVALVSALGYGFGETIAKLSGWPKPMCMVASMVLGIVLEEVISKIKGYRPVDRSFHLPQCMEAVGGRKQGACPVLG